MPTYNIKRNGWKNLHKNTRSTGSCYERKAADYLKQQGLFILRYNYRCRFGEIDLIARDGEYLVFVEVKTRKENSLYAPILAVTKQKQNKLMKTAYVYLKEYPTNKNIRFDIIEVIHNSKKVVSINHIKNAFMQGGSYGSF